MSERLEAELAALRRKRDPDAALIFAMLDVDHFKKINDTYGHAAGDLVLKTLGRFFRQHARRMDVIGRCGGEEVALIMPATGEAGGLQALERIRDGFSQIRHQVGEQAFTATLSGGWTVADGSRTAGEVRAAADSALYEAKRAGRNRVVLASQGVTMPG